MLNLILLFVNVIALIFLFSKYPALPVWLIGYALLFLFGCVTQVISLVMGYRNTVQAIHVEIAKRRNKATAAAVDNGGST